MPQNKPRAKQSAKQRSPWKAIGIVIGIVLVIAGGFYISQMIGTNNVQSKMTQYLEDKYDKEFVVDKPKLTGAGIGVAGAYRAQAYPSGNSDLEFEVGKAQEKDQFFDGYSGAVWAAEERPRVHSFLETIYADTAVPDFDLRTHIPTSASPNPITGDVPSINDAINKYIDNFYYGVTIRLTTDHELSEIELSEHTEKIREIANFVLKKDISSPAVRYAINIEGENAGYLCNLYKDQLSDRKTINSCLTKTSGKVW